MEMQEGVSGKSGHPLFYVLHMIEIVEIKYRETHIQLTLDTGEVFQVPGNITGHLTLKKGLALDTAMYEYLKDESERFTCRRKALDYLSLRNRTVQELRMLLKKKNFSESIISEILDSLTSAGYINDYKYAVDYISARRRNKVIGDSLLKSELYRKGVPSKSIDKAIRKSDDAPVEFEDIYRESLKKLARIEHKKNKPAKIALFLRQRGFDSGIIRKVIDRMKEEKKLLEEFPEP